MRVFNRFSTGHDDLIHDISYDYYGKRLATCSSDQKIKVWDQNEVNGEWSLSTDWKAHCGSVWKLAWAHPEFGSIIASCSYDKTVIIWEETEDEKGNKKWIARASLVDSRESVTDIKFAPRHIGLKLATCSADGYVRIYEAIDVMNLAHWPLIDEFEAHKGGNNCLSWNPSPFDRAMLVVGSNDQYVKVWEYNDTIRKWVSIESLVCGSAENLVHDVSWAPNMGRQYHKIAVACKDKTVRIFKISLSSDKSPPSASTTPSSSTTPTSTTPPPSSAATPSHQHTDVKEVMCRNDHHSEVWRVSWNITGTLLASSGDDGNVRLWKPNLMGEWRPLSIIQAEEDK